MRFKRSVLVTMMFVTLVLVLLLTSASGFSAVQFKPIPGFSDEANQQLVKVFDAIADEKGEVVAAFDWGKTISHKREGSGYMSHNIILEHAKQNPEKAEACNAVVIADETDDDNYFILRSSSYWEGILADDIAKLGYEVYKNEFGIFPAMRGFDPATPSQ